MVTHGGVTGIHAANHAEEEFSIAIVLVPIPLRQTVEATAKDQIDNHADVAIADAQVRVFTRSLRAI